MLFCYVAMRNSRKTLLNPSFRHEKSRQNNKKQRVLEKMCKYVNNNWENTCENQIKFVPLYLEIRGLITFCRVAEKASF